MVFAFTSYNGQLIAGGDFLTAGGNPAAGVAAWNGVSWSQISAGIPYSYPEVFALTVYNGALVAGGYILGGMNHLARWDGTSWSALGGGCDNEVQSLTVSGANLIAGGYFTHAGGVNASGVASWNGSAFAQVGDGTNEAVYALAASGSDLYAGGFFTQSAPYAVVDHIAHFDGTFWHSIGGGLDLGDASEPSVEAMVPYSAGWWRPADSAWQAGSRSTISRTGTAPTGARCSPAWTASSTLSDSTTGR